MNSLTRVKPLTPSSKPTKNLPDLALQINQHHEAAQRNAQKAIERAFQCGEALAQAKAQVKHGEWLTWLQANTIISERTARKYMMVANNRAALENGTEADLTVNGALRALAKPRHRIYDISTEEQRDRLDLMVNTQMLAPTDIESKALLDFYADCAHLGAVYQDWLMSAHFYREQTGATGNLLFEHGLDHTHPRSERKITDPAKLDIQLAREEWYQSAVKMLIKYNSFSPNKMTTAGLFMMTGEMIIVRMFDCDDGWSLQDAF